MKRIVATLGVLAALAFPVGVLADTTGGGDVPPAGSTGGMTVQIWSVHLATRAVAQVEVAFSCQPKPASAYPQLTFWDDTSLFVSVRQASGRTIVTGSTGYFFNGDTTCDGTTHVVTIGVPGDQPFKAGSAAVGASGNASYDFENWDTGENGYVPANASTGWLAVKLGK